MFEGQPSFENFISEIFYPCTGLCFHPTKECNSIHLPYFTLPPLYPHLCPTFPSFLGMRVFHITHLLLLLFVSLLFFLGFFIIFLFHFAAAEFSYISPTSICCYRALLYFSYIISLLWGSPMSYICIYSSTGQYPLHAHPAPTASAPSFIILGPMALQMLSRVTIYNFTKHSLVEWSIYNLQQY